MSIDDFKGGMMVQKSKMIKEGWRPPPGGEELPQESSGIRTLLLAFITGLIAGSVLAFLWGERLVALLSI